MRMCLIVYLTCGYEGCP